MNPIVVEMRKSKEMDDAGKMIEIPVPFPIWIKPEAKGNASMCAAIEKAQELAEIWVAAHPNAPPPTVINFTGGEASDGNPVLSAFKLRQVRTTDGYVLLYNVCLSELDSSTVAYPSNKDELPNDRYVEQMFSISSIIPKFYRFQRQNRGIRGIQPNARGFILNSDATSMSLALPFDPH